ncbi:hypothetical protein K435DRAFT_673785 [Dendrothele bispora CBS 962.96]|uniref:Winged helix-turn helix domain-containing protein n=1 Tax=Dendrothele bispora (strain CBS 962.96) TaxID=1314807 RepID=A0A4S8LQV4_DENBC|nr:hypothetical protein K435DRAFT_673785 [Dendrothele bispora CBS 962.96]
MTEIAIDLDMPLQVVQRVIQTWNLIGEVCRERKGKGQPYILSDQNTKFLIAIISWNPDIYLDEIQLELYTQHGVDVSIVTIHRSLKRLGYSSKKVCLPIFFFACIDDLYKF